MVQNEFADNNWMSQTIKKCQFEVLYRKDNNAPFVSQKNVTFWENIFPEVIILKIDNIFLYLVET